MNFYFRVFLPVFCLWLAGCSVVPNKLKTAEEIMEVHPDSALHILQQIHPDKILNESNRALYGLLLYQALDKNDKKLQSDSLIDFSINYYLNHNDEIHLAKSYFIKARKYNIAQCYDEATSLYLKSLDYLQKKNDFALMGKIYSDLGDINAIQINYKESLNKYRYSLDYYHRAGKKTDANYVNISIGRTYRFEKKYKTALRFYSKVIAQTNDSILFGVALQEIGINYFWMKQYDSAQYYLRKSLLYPYRSTNYAIRCYILSDVLFNMGKYDSSRIYALDALKHPSNFFAQRECYRILVNIEYLRKDIKQMGKYMTKYQSYTDSVRKIESQTKSSVLETIHKSSQEASNSKLENRLIVGLILLVVVFSSLFYYLYRKRTKREKVFIEKQYNEHEDRTRREEIFKRQNVLLHKIESLKTEQAEVRKKITPSEKEMMDRRLYDQLIRFDNPEIFFREMDLTLNNLVTKLNSLYIGITPKEMTWCCLYLLQIPNQDVLMLLNYKSESLNKLKQRLAKKTKLSNVTELYDFLFKIMIEK